MNISMYLWYISSFVSSNIDEAENIFDQTTIPSCRRMPLLINRRLQGGLMVSIGSYANRVGMCRGLSLFCNILSSTRQ